MSIATKTGDTGTTGLMFNRRISKCHPRVEAYGCVDELNAALGMARAGADLELLHQRLLSIQKDLFLLMGELATDPQDLDRYLQSGAKRIAPDGIAKLDGWIQELEKPQPNLRGWAVPGANANSAALDLARTICRRAERRVCALQEAGALPNPAVIIYLNRLSDLLWLFARSVEAPPSAGPELI
jgi:cob(I)alamin adenosyltransferase